MPSITRPMLAAVGLVVLSVSFLPGGFSQSAPDAALPATNSQVAGSTGDDPIRRVGGPVSAPALISRVAPRYSDQARAEKFGGTVLVGLIVGTDGVPQKVHVIRGLGHGLDEKALEAISQYRFKPAMLEGKPVPVQVNVEVNFRIIEKPDSK